MHVRYFVFGIAALAGMIGTSAPKAEGLTPLAPEKGMSLSAPKAPPVTPEQRYIYEVWRCFANDKVDRCDEVAGYQHLYQTLEECHENAVGHITRGPGGVSWDQCFRMPTWTAAEPPPPEVSQE